MTCADKTDAPPLAELGLRSGKERRPRHSCHGSGPARGWDREINHLGGGRGVYVRDPDGHSYELFTAEP